MASPGSGVLPPPSPVIRAFALRMVQHHAEVTANAERKYRRIAMVHGEFDLFVIVYAAELMRKERLSAREAARCAIKYARENRK